MRPTIVPLVLILAFCAAEPLRGAQLDEATNPLRGAQLDKLVADLMVFVFIETGLPRPSPPKIRFVADVIAESSRLKTPDELGLLEAFPSGYYVFSEQAVYLPETWTGRTISDRGWLVHALAHHAQASISKSDLREHLAHRFPAEPGCGRTLEADACTAQTRYNLNEAVRLRHFDLSKMDMPPPPEFCLALSAFFPCEPTF